MPISWGSSPLAAASYYFRVLCRTRSDKLLPFVKNGLMNLEFVNIKNKVFVCPFVFLPALKSEMVFYTHADRVLFVCIPLSLHFSQASLHVSLSQLRNVCSSKMSRTSMERVPIVKSRSDNLCNSLL